MDAHRAFADAVGDGQLVKLMGSEAQKTRQGAIAAAVSAGLGVGTCAFTGTIHL